MSKHVLHTRLCLAQALCPCVVGKFRLLVYHLMAAELGSLFQALEVLTLQAQNLAAQHATTGTRKRWHAIDREDVDIIVEPLHIGVGHQDDFGGVVPKQDRDGREGRQRD